jgi:type IV pilus assembly protein PilF
MKKGMFMVFVLATTLAACSSSSKKEAEHKQTPPPPIAMNEKPSSKDLDKAARLNIELGMTYLKQEQMARAKTKFIRAKNLAPKLPEAHYSYGYFLERVGEIEEAEKSYQKAIALNAKEGNAHNMYGIFLCRQQKFQRAEKEFLKAIEDPNYTQTAESYENAGHCVLQIPDVAKASEYFEKSLRYDPNRANALLELGIMSYQEKRIQDAKAYYERYSQLAKPNARSLLLGLELAKNAGDRNKQASIKVLLNSKFPRAKAADLLPQKRG